MLDAWAAVTGERTPSSAGLAGSRQYQALVVAAVLVGSGIGRRRRLVLVVLQ